MNRSIRIALLAAALTAPALLARADETLHCTSRQAATPGRAASGSELTLVVDGRTLIQDFRYSRRTASGRKGGAASCEIRRDDRDMWIWMRRGRVTTLSIESGAVGKTLLIEIEQKGNGYEVRFADPNLSRLCAAPAELPAVVIIRRGQEACVVSEEM